MMTEQNPFVGGFEIVAIAEPLGRRGAAIVEHHDPGRNELCIEAVADEKNANRRGHNPEAIDGLSAVPANDSQTNCAQHGEGGPK